MCKGNLNLKSTNDLREIARDLCNEQVIKSWRVFQTMHLSVTEWTLDFRNRILLLNKISKKKDSSGLIFPEAYIISCLLWCGRKWVKKINDQGNKFYVPVYMNKERKKLLFSVMISNESELTYADWYQRGTALISWNRTFDYKTG